MWYNGCYWILFRNNDQAATAQWPFCGKLWHGLDCHQCIKKFLGKGTSCHAGHQEFSGCHIRDEYEVDMRNPLHTGKWRDPPWVWNPGQMSPEVQNRVSSDHTKIYLILKHFFFENLIAWVISLVKFAFYFYFNTDLISSADKCRTISNGRISCRKSCN